ncbi:MAG: DUF3846 domain-containing protein [Acidobacteria bacterium]|nr:DUF3846 domain-containing protein [Acidobacteriota bacterium]
MKIRGILVPQDEEKPLSVVEFEQGDIRAMQGYVGGTFDVIDIDRPPASIWVNDEGKLIQGWTPNRRATILLWIHASDFRGKDVIAGDALITGRPNDDGDTLGVPHELGKLLFEASAYRIEVQTEEGGPWTGNKMVYPDWFITYVAAAHLIHHWHSVVHVRVVAT